LLLESWPNTAMPEETSQKNARIATARRNENIELSLPPTRMPSDTHPWGRTLTSPSLFPPSVCLAQLSQTEPKATFKRLTSFGRTPQLFAANSSSMLYDEFLWRQ
jgi:hypothetical protein